MPWKYSTFVLVLERRIDERGLEKGDRRGNKPAKLLGKMNIS
jgi:hypothetical protein